MARLADRSKAGSASSWPPSRKTRYPHWSAACGGILGAVPRNGFTDSLAGGRGKRPAHRTPGRRSCPARSGGRAGWCGRALRGQAGKCSGSGAPPCRGRPGMIQIAPASSRSPPHRTPPPERSDHPASQPWSWCGRGRGPVVAERHVREADAPGQQHGQRAVGQESPASHRRSVARLARAPVASIVVTCESAMRHVLCIPAVSLPQWGMSDILADIAAIIRFYAAFFVVMALAGKAVARLFQLDAFAGRAIRSPAGPGIPWSFCPSRSPCPTHCRWPQWWWSPRPSSKSVAWSLTSASSPGACPPTRPLPWSEPRRATAALRTGIRISCRGIVAQVTWVRLAMRGDLGPVWCKWCAKGPPSRVFLRVGARGGHGRV